MWLEEWLLDAVHTAGDGSFISPRLTILHCSDESLTQASKLDQVLEYIPNIALQSIMNAKLSLQGFWHCHENKLIKTIQTIPHNLYVSFKSASLYCGLRLILVYPNPQ